MHTNTYKAHTLVLSKETGSSITCISRYVPAVLTCYFCCMHTPCLRRLQEKPSKSRKWQNWCHLHNSQHPVDLTVFRGTISI